MVICDYCAKPAALVSGRAIYPRRPDLFNKRFWRCSPCDAYVGCHPASGGNGDGTKPLGRLANKDLRQAKMRAHAAFDPLWKSGRMRRKEAYGWLAEKLGIDPADCHIGMMDEATCSRVVEVTTAPGAGNA